MEWMWAIQVAVNLLILLLVALLWRERRMWQGLLQGNQLASSMSMLEKRADQMGEEANEMRRRFLGQMKSLQEICDQAKEILERGRQQLSELPRTEEETQIKMIMQEPPAKPLPSLAEVEEKITHSPKDALNLRRLLSESLSR